MHLTALVTGSSNVMMNRGCGPALTLAEQMCGYVNSPSCGNGSHIASFPLRQLLHVGLEDRPIPSHHLVTCVHAFVYLKHLHKSQSPLS